MPKPSQSLSARAPPLALSAPQSPLTLRRSGGSAAPDRAPAAQRGRERWGGGEPLVTHTWEEGEGGGAVRGVGGAEGIAAQGSPPHSSRSKPEASAHLWPGRSASLPPHG
jgi:hypothetical protein